MRYIDTSKLSPDTVWLTLATIALEKLSNSQDQSKFLNDEIPFRVKNPKTNREKDYYASEVWGNLKDFLIRYADPDNEGIKCWYSETIETVDIFVDHFRPKGTIAELTDKNSDLEKEVKQQIDLLARDGYWFLAFDYRNFRLASKSANQVLKPKPTPPNGCKAKGKSSFFPLKQNSLIASNKNEIEQESLVLLDPCNENDPEYLRFNETGKALATHRKYTWQYCRSMVSIEVYALNHHNRLTKGRRDKWGNIANKIKELDELYKKLNGATNGDQFKNKQKNLEKHIEKTSEFSAVAIDCIRYYKQIYSWLESIFPDRILRK